MNIAIRFSPLLVWVLLLGRLSADGSTNVPGVVIHHSPKSSGLYIGSPSLAVLDNGNYLVSHDYFGPRSEEFILATSQVFRSTDRGRSWEKVARITGAFWSGLFVHNGAVHLFGTDRHHGRVVIRRSVDNGLHWTEPTDASNGVILAAAQYHTAPVPVLEHGGRLWRAFEDASAGTEWGKRYGAAVLSARSGADLLQATNWVLSRVLARDGSWLDGQFNAWLEGNMVADRDGGLLNVLRVDHPALPERAALVRVHPEGRTLSFDPSTGFVEFPGGAKKFTIRHDPRSQLYWSVVTPALTADTGTQRPARIRNTLALISSPDLRRWDVRRVLLRHTNVSHHGFQYVDWQFEGEEIIAVCRTAHEDGLGGANNNHDANFLTFHRWAVLR